MPYTLVYERLVGFNVKTSDFTWEGGTIHNIRHITPLIDCPICENSSPIINTDKMSVTVVSDPPLTETKFSDLMSLAYFEEDGTSICK